MLDGMSMMSFRSALAMNSALSKQFQDAGFNISTMSCMTQPYAARGAENYEPVIKISQEHGFSLNATLMIDLKCSNDDVDQQQE